MRNAGHVENGGDNVHDSGEAPDHLILWPMTSWVPHDERHSDPALGRVHLVQFAGSCRGLRPSWTVPHERVMIADIVQLVGEVSVSNV